MKMRRCADVPRDDGVSPVIAVMLMLSLTVILAALVSAYAGGFTNVEKVPQVSVRGEFSQSGYGLEIEHLGKDVVSTQDTIVTVSCSESFGPASHLSWVLSRSKIYDSRKTGEQTEAHAWSGNVTAFRTGESFYVAKADIQPSGDGSPAVEDAYDFTKPENVGKTFYVALSQNGKIFAKAEVLIRK